MTPPIIVGSSGRDATAYGYIRRSHLCENRPDLASQIACPIVGVRCPIIGQPGEGIAVRICIVRVNVDIVVGCREIMGERRRSQGYLAGKVLVLLSSLEWSSHIDG